MAVASVLSQYLEHLNPEIVYVFKFKIETLEKGEKYVQS